MRLCLIFNPAAKGEKARRFQSHFQSFAGPGALKPTAGPGGGRPLAAQAVREGFDTIVAAGGDGTVNEVLNGIGDEPDGFRRVRLALLPLGTVNVFARELGLPLDWPQAWDRIQQNQESLLDLPQVEFMAGGQKQRRYFVQMGGAGLDARAIELLDWEQKKRLGALAYVVAGMKALRGPQPLITVSAGDRTLTGQLVLVGNGRYYGGSFILFPQANPRDGRLDVTLFPRTNWGVLLRCGCCFLTRRFQGAGGAQHFQAESLTLSSPTPVPLEVEGENVGHLPACFTVQPKALRVLH